MPDHVEIAAPPQPQKALPPAPPRRRRSLGWLWLLLLAAAGYGGYRYYKTGQEKQRAAEAAQAARMAHRAVPVTAVPARSGDMPVYMRGLGTITAFNSVAVKSRVDGQLTELYYREGQFVKKGDVLAQIDPRPFEVQLEQAEGQLARDRSQWNDAKANLARYQALWDAKVIARQQLDTQAALVGQYEGTMQADQAAINNARLQLTYARITAPLSGRIGLRQVDVGNIVHAADPNGIATIDQMQPIAALFTIPADNLPPIMARLRAGQTLRVDAYDRDDRTRIATGTLLTVDNQIDPTTGTSRLKAVFPNNGQELFPNQFVNCRLLLDVKHGVVIVPLAAVQRGPQGPYVYLVNPDKTARMQVVTVGITEENNTSISSGVAPGDMVVVDGQDKLQDGSKVELRTPRANAPAQAGNNAAAAANAAGSAWSGGRERGARAQSGASGPGAAAARPGGAAGGPGAGAGARGPNYGAGSGTAIGPTGAQPNAAPPPNPGNGSPGRTSPPAASYPGTRIRRPGQ